MAESVGVEPTSPLRDAGLANLCLTIRRNSPKISELIITFSFLLFIDKVCQKLI